jgi:hypothetical protein
MKNKMIIMLIGMCALFLSFKSQSKHGKVVLAMIGRNDTLTSLINVKSIAAKKIKDNLNFLRQNAFVPGQGYSICDPDDMMPISSTAATDALIHARAQMKAYLDSLIIDPKSDDLITMKKHD